MSFLDDLYREHGRTVQNHVSTELGIDEEKAATVLPQVAPVILAGLKRRMEEQGAENMEAELSEAAAGADVDDIQSLLRQGMPQEGEADPDLGGLLGGKGQEASGMLANQLGISSGAAAKLLPMLAPLIIGMLAKKGQAGGGGGAGGIAGILDRNGDGSILDDLGRIIGGGSGAAGVLGSVLGGGKSGQGGAGDILGSVLGGSQGGQGGLANKVGCISAILGGLLKGKR